MPDLNGAAVFSKLDLNQGYNQLELHEDSRYITTFSTHKGLRQYKHLSFRISSAAKVFQNTIRSALSGIRGVCNISDDVLGYGTNAEDHQADLKAALQRFCEKSLTLNRDKCVFKKHHLDFFRHVFSEQGVSTDPKKVQAILQMASPENPAEVCSLLGMTNFITKFIPQYATVCKPLSALTKKRLSGSGQRTMKMRF